VVVVFRLLQRPRHHLPVALLLVHQRARTAQDPAL
jgi:hypothetical protein